MESVAALPGTVSRAIESLDEFAAEGHRKWFDLCYKFLGWERQAIMLGENIPTETQNAHRKALLYLLKTTEFLLGIDPANADLETLQDRLRISWNLIYNPPTPNQAKEADALLAKYFPE